MAVREEYYKLIKNEEYKKMKSKLDYMQAKRQHLRAMISEWDASHPPEDTEDPPDYLE